MTMLGLICITELVVNADILIAFHIVTSFPWPLLWRNTVFVNTHDMVDGELGGGAEAGHDSRLAPMLTSRTTTFT